MSSKIKKYEQGEQGFFPSLFKYFDDDFYTGFGEKFPATNVVEKKKSYNLELQVPGFDKADVKLEIDKNVLRISAEHKEDHEEKDEHGHILRQEFSRSSFVRNFVIPENVDTENISAKQKDGVLIIALPKLDKAPEDLVKKIEIK